MGSSNSVEDRQNKAASKYIKSFEQFEKDVALFNDKFSRVFSHPDTNECVHLEVVSKVQFPLLLSVMWDVGATIIVLAHKRLAVDDAATTTAGAGTGKTASSSSSPSSALSVHYVEHKEELQTLVDSYSAKPSLLTVKQFYYLFSIVMANYGNVKTNHNFQPEKEEHGKKIDEKLREETREEKREEKREETREEKREETREEKKAEKKDTSVTDAPRTAVNPANATGADADVCCICLENAIQVVLQCSHSFCTTCIDEWNDASKTCPVCRSLMDLKTDDYWVLEDIEASFATIANPNLHPDMIRQIRLFPFSFIKKCSCLAANLQLLNSRSTAALLSQLEEQVSDEDTARETKNEEKEKELRE